MICAEEIKHTIVIAKKQKSCFIIQSGDLYITIFVPLFRTMRGPTNTI